MVEENDIKQPAVEVDVPKHAPSYLNAEERAFLYFGLLFSIR
jgi:hypothetical protein